MTAGPAGAAIAAERRPATVSFDRITKLVVLASAASAVALHAWQLSDRSTTILLTTAALFAAGAVLSRIAEGAAAAVLMTFVFVFPALIFVSGGGYAFQDNVVWWAALLGVMAPRHLKSGWVGPPGWRVALASWAMAIAVAWPLVVWREADFQPTLRELAGATSSVGVPAPVAILWVVDTASRGLLGILWFDWLRRVFDGRRAIFRTTVIAPMLVSGGVAIVAGLYQLFVDMAFLNTGLFTYLRRASGTLRDANPFGAVAAVWTGAALGSLAAVRRSRPVLAGAVAAIVIVSLAAVWGSGSRTALSMLLVLLLMTAFAAWRSAGFRAVTAGLALTAVVVASAVVLWWVVPHMNAVGPLPRLRAMLGAGPVDSVRRVALEMWTRDGYGTAAAEMIARHPLVGVGVGSFQFLQPDVGGVSVLDNAQNWFRQQLVELGLLGSVGWMAWVVLFGMTLFRRVAAGDRVEAAAVRGTILGVAVASIAGVPSQAPSVTIAFWVLAAWYVQLAPVDGAAASHAPSRRSLRVPGALAAAALILFAIGTVYVGRHDLRPPNRAARKGWEYSTGFYPAEPDGVHVARRHGVVVIPATKPWIELTFWVNHFDLASNPVHVQVTDDGRSAVDQVLRSPTPVTGYLRARGPRVVLETTVNRTVRPSDYGIPDPRELGLFLKWEPVDRLPQGATMWP